MSGVAIIDSGGANIASLLFAFKRLGVAADLTDDADVIRDADRVLLPGVGAARDAMNRLREKDLQDVIPALEQPVLGICLGMQLLCEFSEEDDTECLAVFPGTANRLVASAEHPVPNMGWCETSFSAKHWLLDGIDNQCFFYYLHSYAIEVSEHTIATARQAGPFSSIIAKGNFVAAQFHPERSSTAGSRLLRNFLTGPK